MMHSCAFDMIDRFLREIMGVDIPFGGKVVLCSGDFVFALECYARIEEK